MRAVEELHVLAMQCPLSVVESVLQLASDLARKSGVDCPDWSQFDMTFRKRSAVLLLLSGVRPDCCPSFVETMRNIRAMAGATS